MRKSQEIKFRKGYDDDKPLRKAQVRRVRRNAREVIREQLADMAAEQAEFADDMERMDNFMERENGLQYVLSDMLYPVNDEYTYQVDFDDEYEEVWL